MTKIIRMPIDKRPPVFKIKALFEVWRTDDPERASLVIAVEAVGLTAPNREDLQHMARSSALGRLTHIGVDVSKLDYQFENVEFFAARSRTYVGGFMDKEPDWIPATYDLDTKAEAIESMIYLPYDLTEQREVYGA